MSLSKEFIYGVLSPIFDELEHTDRNKLQAACGAEAMAICGSRNRRFHILQDMAESLGPGWFTWALQSVKDNVGKWHAFADGWGLAKDIPGHHVEDFDESTEEYFLKDEDFAVEAERAAKHISDLREKVEAEYKAREGKDSI